LVSPEGQGAHSFQSEIGRTIKRQRNSLPLVPLLLLALRQDETKEHFRRSPFFVRHVFD
jgi:hypothetical protein